MTPSSKQSVDGSPSCPSCSLWDTAPIRSPAGPRCAQCRRPLWYCERTIDGVVFLDVVPTRDRGRADEEYCQCRQPLWREDRSRVVVNLSALNFATSIFVARLIRLLKDTEREGVRLLLCGLHPMVREVFARTRLDELFEIAERETCVLGDVRAAAS